MNYLITGGAGFIGCNLARFILAQGHNVTVLDNFATGHRSNLAELMDLPGFTLIEGDLRDYDAVYAALDGIDGGVSHQGALGSVPRSVDDPRTSHDVNVNGTFNVLEAMRQRGVRRIVMACSSSAYGRHQVSPKHEALTAAPISPYAASKVACEAYLQGFSSVYDIEAVGLRYFNVFGPYQDPNGAYAAVIPRFVAALLAGESPIVYGDGEQSRDFCFIENVCRANWLALNAPAEKCDGIPMNIACNRRISLNDILVKLQSLLGTDLPVEYTEERAGDIKHSMATLERAKTMIGYEPQVYFDEGLERAIDWYKANL
jgi:nucleoside-diphosphate-sugar epimerase